MNKNIKFLLFLSLFFTLTLSAMQPEVTKLVTSLGTLKTNLTTLSSSLTDMNEQEEPEEPETPIVYPAQSNFNQDALDIYALYGDDPTIIEDRTTLKRDKTRNPRLVKADGTLDMRPYTGYGYKTTNLQKLADIIVEMKSTAKLTSADQITAATPSLQKAKNKLAALFTKPKTSSPIAYEVPAFRGISSAKIKQYLGKKGLDISKEWARAIISVTPKEQQDSLKDKNLPEAFKKEIKTIEGAVKNIFVGETSVDLDSLFKSAGLNAFLTDTKAKSLKLMARSTGKEDTPELANAGGNETIGNVNPDAKSVLMALGTGQQGGAPATGGAEEKLGVVSSYFGIKSFTQRIGAPDPTIYEEPPTPALLQVMIGETKDEIPSCGVMFTEEPEGGIARDANAATGKGISKATGQFLTTGITRIECSYGLNEGVVNSMVPVDVYYIDRNKTLDSIIRKKDKRVIATDNGIDIVTNKDVKQDGKAIATQPALSAAELTALKTLSNYLEFYYRRPMDVEFVVKKKNLTDKSRTIYLVQARPIVNSKKKIQASYIFDLNDSKTFPEKVSGEVIGSAGGALRLIRTKDESVITDTLKEALEVYDKLPKANKAKINCIIVKDMAPATSHEATQFRTYQIAVICIPKVNETIKTWFAAGKAVLVDIQQETAVVWDVTKDIDTTIAANIILKKGWINYPIPMKLSLNDRKDQSSKKLFSKMTLDEIKANIAKFTAPPVFAADIKDQAKTEALAEFKTAITKSLTKKPTTKVPAPKTPTIAPTTKVPMIVVSKYLQNIKDYFALLKTEDEKKAQRNLLKICFGALTIVEKILTENPDDADIAYQANLILNHLLIQADNVSKTLNITPEDKDYYQRLYTIRFLEAVLFQTPSKDILNSYSLDVLTKQIYLKETKAGKKLKTALGKTPVTPDVTPEKKAFLVQYAKATDYILTDNVQTSWFALLKQVSGTPEASQKNFNNLFGELADNNLLTQWFLLSFDKITKGAAINSAPVAATIITQLNKDYEKNRPLIETLKEKREEFNTLEISLWSQPSKFAKQLKQLTKIGAFFKDPNFFTAYKASGDLGKIFAMQVMEEFVDLFDRSIKELEVGIVGRDEKDAAKIAENMKTLLTLFLSFVDAWVKNFNPIITIPNPAYTAGSTEAETMVEPTADKYNLVAAKLTSITGAALTAAQLKMTPKDASGTGEFDVSESSIGGTKPTVLNLNTLEDIFTFIHQSLLNILGFVGQGIDVTGISLPLMMNTAEQEITSVPSVDYKFAAYQIRPPQPPINYSYEKSDGHQLPTIITASSLSFGKNKLIRKYNYPLRGHGMNITVSFDIPTNKAVISCIMSGEGIGAGGSEYARFAKIIDYLDIVSAMLGLKFNSKFENDGLRIVWNWEIDKDTPPTSVQKIRNLILASVAMSFAVDGYNKAMLLEAAIYEATFGTYLGTAGNKQALCNTIIEKSRTEYERLQSVFVTALEKLPSNLTASKDNWLKTIEILGRLLKDPAYRINTECFFFKKYHVIPDFYSMHPQLGNLGFGAGKLEYHRLSPADYVQKVPKTKQAYFKFREAKKILNYLCQASQYFDAACWTALLNVIKDNASVIASFTDLTLDNIEGYEPVDPITGPAHPAAANLTTSSTNGRILPLEASMTALYANAAKNPAPAVKILGTATQAAVAAAKLAPQPIITTTSALDDAKDAIASGDLDEFLAVCPKISNGSLKDPDLIKSAGTALLGFLSNDGIIISIVPSNPGKRKTLTDFGAFMLAKNHITPEMVWKIAKPKPAQRITLVCMLILFEAVYNKADFFTDSLPFVLERLDGSPNTNQIALDCYNALKTNVTAKKYTAADITALKTSLTPITTKLDKKVELVTLIASKYP